MEDANLDKIEMLYNEGYERNEKRIRDRIIRSEERKRKIQTRKPRNKVSSMMK